MQGSNEVDEAFKAAPRSSFLPPEVQSQADLDSALPIGHGQTISQPYTVRLMLNWLDVKPGNTILDVGSGSGWTTALLAYLTGPKGRVVAIERLPELVQTGAHNCQKLKIKNVEFHLAGKSLGYQPKGPYERILVSAAARYLPDELIDQLKPNGRLVIPVKNSIFVIVKDNASKISKTEHYGFVFVPLI